jgi:deoxyribose-phosphate aldolase
VDLNDLSQEELASVVNEVVRRVVARLEGGEPVVSAKPPEAPTALCVVSSERCTGCGNCVERRPEDVRTIIDQGASRVGAQVGTQLTAQDIAAFIDHTLLKPNAKEEEIVQLCNEAREFGFAAVVVNPSYVPLVASLLANTPVKICTVVGFPLGSMTTEAKAFETRDAVAKGAHEIDMVINVGKLKSGDYQYVMEDIKAVVKAAQHRTVKVIIEAAMLTDDEKVAACILAKAGGAQFVKTSTGFGPGGATAHDVALIRRTVGPQMGVKAAGGIRDLATAAEMVKAGATRIGASASVQIMTSQSSAR